MLLNSLNQTLNLINLLANPILNNNNFYSGSQSIRNNNSFPNWPINNILTTILMNNMLCNSFPFIFQNYSLNNQNQNQNSNPLKNFNSEINNLNNNIIKDNSINNNTMKDCNINKLINDNGPITDNDNEKR